MFEDFDFAVLDDPTFKEDAVREEIIAPILRRIGFRPTGKDKVQRSQKLTHPYVMIGTRKHPVYIIPDYTLWNGEKALLILDAKAPSEEVVRSVHAEQAYSYAIHPEVRAPYYALCNGWRLVVYEVAHFEAVLDVVAADYDRRWPDIERILRPESLLNPAYRDFLPDLGLALRRMGIKEGETVDLLAFNLTLVSKLSDGMYTAATETLFDGAPYLASLDFPGDALKPLLSCLAQPLLDGVVEALARAPFKAFLDRMVEVDLQVTLGPLTQGEHDAFVPLELIEVRGTRFDRQDMPEDPTVPHYVHSLRRAFNGLRGK